MQYEVSCGAVVFTRTAGERRYVIVKSLEGYYGFPKGHVEAGETEEQTAYREIWEETGLKPQILPGFKVEDEYPLPKKPGVMKKVVYFAAEYTGQRIVHQVEELETAALMTYEQAMAVFQFESTKKVMRAAKTWIDTLPRQ